MPKKQISPAENGQHQSMHLIHLHHGQRTFSAWCNKDQESIKPGSFDRLIIFMHGFPDNRDSYHAVVPIVLQDLGPKTLAVVPLLRGYEVSSQGGPNNYTMAELADDVRLWIIELVPDQSVPVHLVGHDWGAVVAFKTASKYPNLITLMVTMAIPYLSNLHLWHFLWYAPSQLYYSSYMLRMQSPLFYRPKFGNLEEPGYLDQLWVWWSPGWDFSKEIESVRTTLALEGVLDHATAYYRNVLTWKNRHEMRWNVDFEKVPTLILGGDIDGCMVPALFELESRLLAPIPKVKVQLLSGVGHFLHREDPERVGSLVSLWFKKYLN